MSAKRENGTGTITKCSDGYWRAKIQIGKDLDTGKPITKSFSGKTKAAVTKKLKEYRENLGQHKSEAIRSQVDSENKKEDKTAYLEDEMISWAMSVKKRKLKADSFRRLISTITNQIVPRIGFLEVSEVSPDIIQSFVNDMFDDGLSLSSIKKAKSALHDYYSYWQKMQLSQKNIVMNPVDLVETPGSNEFQSGEVKCLNDDEVKKFIDALHSKDGTGAYKYEYHDLISLILNTGIRLGEACGIEIGDYNRKEKTLFIKRNVAEISDINVGDDGIDVGSRYLQVQNTTKTASGYRKLPLNMAAVDNMEQLIKRAEAISPKQKYIAITSDNTMLWPSNLRKSINRIFKAASVDKSGVHILRHTYATALFAQKIDIKTVSSLLGHANIQVTANIYVHFTESIKYSDTTKNKFQPYPEYLLERSRL